MDVPCNLQRVVECSQWHAFLFTTCCRSLTLQRVVNKKACHWLHSTTRCRLHGTSTMAFHTKEHSKNGSAIAPRLCTVFIYLSDRLMRHFVTVPAADIKWSMMMTDEWTPRFTTASSSLSSSYLFTSKIRHSRCICEQWLNYSTKGGGSLFSGETALYFDTNNGWGRHPLPLKICAQSDPSLLKSVKFDQYLRITSQPYELATKFNYREYEVDHALSDEL